MTKVLIISYSYRPYIGGLETFTESLADGLIAKGYKVEVAVKLEWPSEKNLNVGKTTNPANVFFDVSLFKLFKLARNSDIIIFSQFSLYYFPIIYLLRRKYLVIHHTSEKIYGDKVHFIEKCKIFICKNSKNVFVSRSLKDIINLPGQVIHNATVWGWQKNYWEGDRDTDVLFVGRLVPGKGVDVLIDSIKIARDKSTTYPMVIHIIGDGDQLKHLQRKSNELKLNDVITFLGSQDAKTIRQAMLKSKVVVVPSQFHEPFGLVAIEALMAGCIPVVSDVGGIFEACRGHAFKFNAHSSQQLADLLESTLDDFKIKRDSIFSDFRSEYFQIERMVNEYSQHIDRIIESN